MTENRHTTWTCDRCGMTVSDRERADHIKCVDTFGGVSWSELSTSLHLWAQGETHHNGKTDLCPDCAEKAKDLLDGFFRGPVPNPPVPSIYQPLWDLIMREDPFENGASKVLSMPEDPGTCATLMKNRLLEIFGEVGTKRERDLHQLVFQMAKSVPLIVLIMDGESSHTPDEPASYTMVGGYCISEHHDRIEAAQYLSNIRQAIFTAICNQGRAAVDAVMTGRRMRFIDPHTLQIPEETPAP